MLEYSSHIRREREREKNHTLYELQSISMAESYGKKNTRTHKNSTAQNKACVVDHIIYFREQFKNHVDRKKRIAKQQQQQNARLLVRWLICAIGE